MPLSSLSGGRSPMMLGPSLWQARHRKLPLCQGLPTSHRRCIHRTADNDTDDVATKRKAELAPRSTCWRSRGRNASAGARICGGWDDLLGDARDVPSVESAREGHLHRCAGRACIDQ